jgi:hypothetical protein
MPENLLHTNHGGGMVRSGNLRKRPEMNTGEIIVLFGSMYVGFAFTFIGAILRKGFDA